MPQSAELQSLAVKLGTIVVISAPQEHAPSGLDWSRWVSNTALRFERFEPRASHRILLVDRLDKAVETNMAGASEFSRRDLQNVDPMALLTDQGGGHVLLTSGVWKYSISSWVESLKQISQAKYCDVLPTFLELQFSEWRQLSARYRDDSMFVLSDSGMKFTNASEQCHHWTQRVVRSRIIQEVKQGAWSAGVMRLFDDRDLEGTKVRVQRSACLLTTEWCGDPDWETRLENFVIQDIKSAKEIWVSLPFAGLSLDVADRLKRVGLSATVQTLSPASVVGWHPIRDFMLFMGSKAENRIFVFMDSLERLQIIAAQTLSEVTS